jgi:pimeloyl-ACP methyl ester carboxylesterase
LILKTVQSKDGTRIAYDETGQGPALILVGGALSFRNFPGAVELVQLLAPHFKVINFDRRGRGDSTDTKPYSIEREIEDLAALIEAAGGSAYVYGMSSGAALALIAANKLSAIKRIALYEPPFVAVDPKAKLPPADYQAQLQRLIDANNRSGAVKYFITKIIGAPAFLAWIMPLMPIWKNLKSVAHTLPYDMAIMDDFSFPQKLTASVKVPTVVIGGEKSPESLRLAVKATADAMPNAKAVFLAKQSHNVSMKVLAPAMIEHLLKE